MYVGNRSYQVSNADLESWFSPSGEVRRAEGSQVHGTGRSKGFKLVEMADDNGATEAINGLREKEHEGRSLTVNEAWPRDERSGGGRSYGGNRVGYDR